MKKTLVRISIVLLSIVCPFTIPFAGIYSVIHWVFTGKNTFDPFMKWFQNRLIAPLEVKLKASRTIRYREPSPEQKARAEYNKQFRRRVGEG